MMHRILALTIILVSCFLLGVDGRVLKKTKKSSHQPSTAPSEAPSEGTTTATSPLFPPPPNPLVNDYLQIRSVSVDETDDFIGTKVRIDVDVGSFQGFAENVTIACEAMEGTYPVIEKAQCSIVLCQAMPCTGSCTTWESNGLFNFDIEAQQRFPRVVGGIRAGNGRFVVFDFITIPELDLTRTNFTFAVGYYEDPSLVGQRILQTLRTRASIPESIPPEAIDPFGLSPEICMAMLQQQFESGSTESAAFSMFPGRL